MPLLLKFVAARWRELTILALLCALTWARQQNDTLQAQLLAKPEVKEVVSEDSTKNETIHRQEQRGRVTTTVRYVHEACGQAIPAEKITVEDPVNVALDKVVENTKQLDLSLHQTPVCLGPSKRFVGLWLSPRHGKNVEGAYLGYSFGPFDLALGWAWEGLRGPKGQVSVRF